MTLKTEGKIDSIPRDWRFTKIDGNAVCFVIDGHACSFTFELFTDDALRVLRAIFLGKIHSLTIQRWNLHRYLAIVNGEMDRRVNEKACEEEEFLKWM